MLKDNNKGMITIEACVIVPIIMAVTLLLIWLSLYFYNKTTLANAASVASVFAARSAEESNEQISKIALEKAEELLDGRLIAMDDVNTKVSVDYGLVTVNITGQMQVPGVYGFGLVVSKMKAGGINIIENAPRLRCSQIIRTANRVRHSVSDNNV